MKKNTDEMKVLKNVADQISSRVRHHTIDCLNSVRDELVKYTDILYGADKLEEADMYESVLGSLDDALAVLSEGRTMDLPGSHTPPSVPT